MWQICDVNCYKIISSKEEISMPKLLNERRLNKVQYISMADYLSSMDSLTDFDDKMAFTTRYLLAYGSGQQRDVSFPEAVRIAQMKIAQASAQLKRGKIIINTPESVNPDIDADADSLNRQFMIEPIQYLQNENTRLLHNEANDGVSQESKNRMANYQAMSIVLANDMDGSISYAIDELNVEPTTRDFKTIFSSRYGGFQQVEKAYNDTKPGILSKAFGTSSVAYHNLDETYKAFNNPNHVLYGNLNSLDKAATEYLKHVFPRWDPEDGMISPQVINTLKGTKKARAMFSYNILKTTKEQREMENARDQLVTSNLQKRAEEAAQAGDEVLEENNNDFQQNLLEDIKEDQNIEIDPEAEKEYAANFIDGPDLDND